MNKESFYITTPIYYVNDVPHIGHAYTTIACDTLARYKRLLGKDVFFLTGTDEHGQKVERSAEKNGETPKNLADRMVERYKKLWMRLNITNDDFIRTTDKRHTESVYALFKKVYDKGDIYLGEYEGWYCTPCETFWTETQLEKGDCPDCRRSTEKLKEESYFFRMSKYQDKLLEHIQKNPDFISPQGRRNEIINFIKTGLRDLSISRTSFKWGIKLPNNEKHVLYVWFDALTNYLSALGFKEGDNKYKTYWPANVHILGKDIIRFHAIYWPAFLMSAGLLLPKKIFSHGWWTIEGKKMSKSLKNIVEPHSLIDTYGVDPIRYFLLREVPFGLDGDFSHQALKGRINNDLANDLGNLLQRVLTMTQKYFDGRIPQKQAGDEKDSLFIDNANKTVEDYKIYMEDLSFHQALTKIWELISLSNKYIVKREPWTLAKDKNKLPDLEGVIYTACESLRIIAFLLSPFMPETAEKIEESLGINKSTYTSDWKQKTTWGVLNPGTQIKKGEQLFPRIMDKKKTDTDIQNDKKSEKQQDNATNCITIDEFFKAELKVGCVTDAQKVEKSKKLMVLTVDLGSEKRTVVAGIALSYSAEDLIGKRIVIVSNLKPAKLMGIESQGMLLAASKDDKVVLAEFNEDVESGIRVK